MVSGIKASFYFLLYISLLFTCLGLVSAFELDLSSQIDQKILTSETIWLIDKSVAKSSDFKKYFEENKSLDNQEQEKIEEIDCSGLAKLLTYYSKSVLFIVDYDQEEKIKARKCESQKDENLLNVISFSNNFNENQSRENQTRPIFNSFEVDSQLPTIGKVVPVSLCKEGYFSFTLNSCSYYSRRLDENQEKELLYLYGNLSQFYDVPNAVTLSAGSDMTHDFFIFLTGELRKYTFGTASTPGNVFTVGEYESVHDAILILLSSAREKAIVLTDVEWKNAFEISEIVFSLSDPSSFEINSKIKFSELAFHFLQFFKKQDHGNCPGTADSDFVKELSFPSAVSQAFDLINRVFILTYQGGLGPEGSRVTEEFPVDGTESVLIQVSFDFSESFKCSCNFCNEGYSLIKVEVVFNDFGYSGDIFGSRVYISGQMNQNVYIYHIPAVLGQDLNNCFEFTKTIGFTFDSDSGVGLHSDQGHYFSTAAIVAPSNIPNTISLVYSTFGLFAPIVVCPQGTALNSILRCSPCGAHCKCSCPGSCESCFFNFRFNSITLKCDSCSLGYTSDDCSTCSMGFKNVGNSLSCTECSEGFMSSSSSELLCDVCQVGFGISATSKCGDCAEGFKDSGDKRCSVCQEGFEDSGTSKCSVCKQGFQDYNGKKCSTCEEGFQDFNGLKCSVCQEGFVDFEQEKCSKCAEGFTNDPTGKKCSICEEGFQNDENGKKCSICSQGFTIDLETGKKCSKCSLGFANDDEKGTKCSVCAEGFVSDVLSLNKCSICADGFLDDTINGSRCSLCAANFENDSNGKKCAKCKKGYQNSLDMTSKCSICDVGYKSSSTDQVLCDLCSIEYGKDSEGACLPCGSNCFCQFAGGCDSCKPGYIHIPQTGCFKGFKYISETDIISAVLDSSFSSVMIETNKFFDIIYNGESCDFFFINYEILGTNARCSLKYLNNLFISLGLDFTLDNKSSLRFASNVLMKKTEILLSTYSVLVSYESEPKVTAVIAGPSIISFDCGIENVKLEYWASGSFGALKQRFTYTWSVSFDSALVTVDSIEGLNLEKYSFKLATSVNGLIVVSLTISNGLYTSTATMSVILSSTKNLSFKLDSGSGSSFKRGSDISISAIIIDICGCSSKLNYAWTLTNSQTSNPVTGLYFSNSKLRITKNTLEYGDYLVSLTINCEELISGTSSSTITILSSDLVIQTNKGNQQISSEVPFSISAINSYDPDGYSLVYLWSYLEQSSSSQSLTIPNSLFASLTTFNLLLQISTVEGQRSASKTFELTVLNEALPSISILGPSRKVGLSATVVIKASTSEKSVQSVLTWSQVTGPKVIFSSLKTNLWFEPKSLVGGSAYTFMLTVAVGTLSASSSVSFTSNKEPFCSGGLKSNPSAPYYKNTKISFSLEGCADGDNQDLPLSFKFYLMKPIKTYLLLIFSSSPAVANIALPVVTAGVKLEACDSLADCAKFEQELQILSSKRFLSESLLEEYLMYKIYFDTLPAVVLVLATGDVDEELIDLMWKDFQEFCEQELKGNILVTEILSTVYLFLNQTLDEKRAVEYLQYLKNKVEETVLIDLESMEYVMLIVDLVCKVSSKLNIRKLSLDFLQVAAQHFDQNGDQVKFFSICGETLHFDGLADDLKEVKINTVEIEKVKAEENEKIDARISVLFSQNSSLLINSDIFSSEYDVNFESPKSRKRIEKGKLELYIKKEDFFINEIACSNLDGESKDCSIKFSNNSGFVIVLEINKVISVYPSTKNSSSSLDKNIALYAILSLIFLFLFSIPFLICIDYKLKLKHSKIIKTEYARNSEKSFETGKDNDSQISFREILHEHLTTSLFTDDQNLCKFSKFSWLVSIFISEIFFQTLLLKFTSLEAILVGLLSVAITFPISYLYLRISLYNDFSSSKEFLISVLSILSMLLGLEIAYFLGAQENWLTAFGTGLIVELIVSQPLLACVKRLVLSS